MHANRVRERFQQLPTSPSDRSAACVGMPPTASDARPSSPRLQNPSRPWRCTNYGVRSLSNALCG